MSIPLCVRQVGVSLIARYMHAESRPLAIVSFFVCWGFVARPGGVKQGFFNKVFINKRGEDPMPDCPVIFVFTNQVQYAYDTVWLLTLTQSSYNLTATGNNMCTPPAPF